MNTNQAKAKLRHQQYTGTDRDYIAEFLDPSGDFIGVAMSINQAKEIWHKLEAYLAKQGGTGMSITRFAEAISREPGERLATDVRKIAFVFSDGYEWVVSSTAHGDRIGKAHPSRRAALLWLRNEVAAGRLEFTHHRMPTSDVRALNTERE